MSYFLLPKNNIKLNILPIFSCKDIKVYISHSLYFYFKNFEEFLNLLRNHYDEYCNINFIVKEMNPYEYIFSKVPGSNFSVSKLKQKSNLFYDFLEISNTLSLFDNFKNKNIKCIHISPNYNDSVECFELLRENKMDEIIYTKNVNYNYNDIKFDFLFYELENEKYKNINEYIILLLEILRFLLKYQNVEGVCLIKIDKVFHRPVIDILYLLNSMYEKTYIIKPNTSHLISHEKYIVCKYFIVNEERKKLYQYYFQKITSIIEVYYSGISKNIHQIIEEDISCLFMEKINETNVIIGQKQLENMDQIINIYKNKNKEEKIDYVRKINIQKSVDWCEKYKIPYNKFTEKINIFLPIIKDDIEKEINTEGVK